MENCNKASYGTTNCCSGTGLDLELIMLLVNNKLIGDTKIYVDGQEIGTINNQKTDSNINIPAYHGDNKTIEVKPSLTGSDFDIVGKEYRIYHEDIRDIYLFLYKYSDDQFWTDISVINPIDIDTDTQYKIEREGSKIVLFRKNKNDLAWISQDEIRIEDLLNNYYTKLEVNSALDTKLDTLNQGRYINISSDTISVDVGPQGVTPRSDLQSVAFSGNYNDLLNTPDIPTVNNKTITIKKNNLDVDSFLLNQDSNKSINISVPTKTTDLINDAGFVTTDTTYSAGTGITLNSVTNAFSANIVDDVTSTSTTSSLSANMGYNLQQQINNLKSRGRFLSLWNCQTGLPLTDPTELPYTYRSGDYYIVYSVSTNNYKPSGTQYTGLPSTTIETGTIKDNDTYYYDGSNWILVHTSDATISFENIVGDAMNNSNLAGYFNAKQNEINSLNPLSVQYVSGLHSVATSGSYNDLSNKPTIGDGTITIKNNSGSTYGTFKTNQTGDTDVTIPVSNAKFTIKKNNTDIGHFSENTNIDLSINITVPTNTSDLNNDSGFLTQHQSIKTVNGNTLVGQGNVDIPSGDINVQSDWNLTDSHQDDFIKNKPNKYFTEKLDDYLYKIDCPDLDYDYAYNYFLTTLADPNPGSCTTVRKGNYIGRNFDWTYDNNIDFVVFTHGNQNRFSSIGFGGSVNGLDKAFIESKAYSETYKIVPFKIVDGVNEKGVVVSINVVPQDKGNTSGTTPTLTTLHTICSRMLPRFILDNFDSAFAAVDYIEKYVSVYNWAGLGTTLDYDLHIMVSDRSKSYLIEFVNNATIVLDISNKAFVTNFHLDGVTLNSDGSIYTPEDYWADSTHNPITVNGVTSHGSGIERYNLVNTRYDSMLDYNMRQLMWDLRYTNAYQDSITNIIPPIWYSECVGVYQGTDIRLDSPLSSILTVHNAMKTAFNTRSRDNADTWQTVHCCIYDYFNNNVRIYYQELLNKSFIFDWKNVVKQADWNETDIYSESYIRNKPTNVSAFTNDAGYINLIKTINNQTLIGSGNIDILGGLEWGDNYEVYLSTTYLTVNTLNPDTLRDGRLHTLYIKKPVMSLDYVVSLIRGLQSKPSISSSYMLHLFMYKGTTLSSLADITDANIINNGWMIVRLHSNTVFEILYLSANYKIEQTLTSGTHIASIDGIDLYAPLGGGGSTVTYTQTLTTGDECGTITIDGVAQKIYSSPQIQADWTESTTTDLGYIKNKPTLATVATSGSYNDLSNTPTIPTVSYTPILTSGTECGEITINGTQQIIYAPNGSSGGGLEWGETFDNNDFSEHFIVSFGADLNLNDGKLHTIFLNTPENPNNFTPEDCLGLTYYSYSTTPYTRTDYRFCFHGNDIPNLKNLSTRSSLWNCWIIVRYDSTLSRLEVLNISEPTGLLALATYWNNSPLTLLA